MFNILLDPLPEEWNGYPIDSDFRIGIQISQCLEDKSLSKLERKLTAINLLFPDEDKRPELEEANSGLKWFLNEFSHDKHKSTGGSNPISFDNDQWRIYAAFFNQYRIDLNTIDMHWFTFMGLLSNLCECSFNGVVDIRQKKLTSKMSKEEKEAYNKAKEVYSLAEEEPISDEQKEVEAEAVAQFQKLIGK